MENIGFFVFLLVVIGLIVLSFGLLKRYESESKLPFQAQRHFLSQPELRFFTILNALVGEQFHILAKVRLIDLLDLEQISEDRTKWKNRVIQKHVDFVLADPTNLQPYLVIELDDRSHERPSRQQSDQFKNQLFESVGLPLLRIPVKPKMDPQEIQSILEAALKKKQKRDHHLSRRA